MTGIGTDELPPDVRLLHVLRPALPFPRTRTVSVSAAVLSFVPALGVVHGSRMPPDPDGNAPTRSPCDCAGGIRESRRGTLQRQAESLPDRVLFHLHAVAAAVRVECKTRDRLHHLSRCGSVLLR